MPDVEVVEFDADVHRWLAETVSLISEDTITLATAESRSFGRSAQIAYTEHPYLAPKARAGVVYDYTTISRPLGQLQHVRAGWPCLAFEGGSGRPPAAPAPPVQYFNAIEVDSEAGIPLPANESRRLVPLAPIWSGFVINTLFYAGLIWCLTAGPFVARRALRRRRGRCLKCAYPIGDRDVCTECGEAISAGKPAR